MRYFILFIQFLITPLIALAQSPNITAQEAYAASQAGERLIIDVRTPTEWHQTGMAEGAIGVNFRDADFLDQIITNVEGDKSRPIALICRTGGRSTRAMGLLRENGFTNIRNVKEGMLGNYTAGPGWLARELPIQKPRVF